MNQPKTLLEMAGADAAPASLAASAVIVIDCQMEYVTGALPLPGVDAALGECALLLKRARAAGTPVIHIIHKGKPGGAFDLDGSGGKISDDVAPTDGEAIIEKSLPNSFAGTSLDAVLKETGRTSLIIAGFMTHMCVSSTTRAALDLGYTATVVGNATATRDLPSVGGGVLGASDLQVASLTALSDRFAVIAEKTADLPD